MSLSICSTIYADPDQAVVAASIYRSINWHSVRDVQHLQTDSCIF
jgi:hypothetical protein